MNPSKLDRQITIQAQSEVLDSFGDRSNEWSDLVSCFANVSIRSGSEVFRAKKLFDTAEAVFVIRYRSDITPQHRIVYSGENWGIISVEEIGRRDGLRLVARRFNNV